MTDRELLEMAAKAVGIELTFEHDKPQRIEMFRGHLANYEDWDPLADDGDALRLAVMLRMAVYVGDGGSVLAESDDYRASEVIDIQTCHYAATRRAITRAAAEIGKEMP